MTILQDTVIELREERHKDVVYSITIKKDGSLQRNGSLNKSVSSTLYCTVTPTKLLGHMVLRKLQGSQ